MNNQSIDFSIPMRLKILFDKARGEYLKSLRDSLDNKPIDELVVISLNSSYSVLIKDYIDNHPSLKFRQQYESARKSVLEQRAQSSPKLTEPIDQLLFDDSSARNPIGLDD